MIKKFDTNKEYHSKDSISASGLKIIATKSVEHFLNADPIKTSKEMVTGSAVHTMLLEGEKQFSKEYYLQPKLDLRTKQGKEQLKVYEKIANNKELIDQSQMQIISGIYSKFMLDPLAKKYCKGAIELSHYLDIEGVPVRVRPDCIGDDWISDIKTTIDNSPRAFKSEIYRRKYHLQACFYCDTLGYDPYNFRFIACEKSKPYTVKVYALDDAEIENGRKEYQKAFLNWKLYIKEGIVTSYDNENTRDDGSIVL